MKNPRKKSRPPIQFHSRDRIGKAGERFVESFVEEKLKFAYRRGDRPDIGVDGEIETFDTGGLATGGLLKAQVKSTSGSLVGRDFRVPFDEEHLEYFDSLVLPTALFVVSLADQAIWWKPILNKENYRGSRGGYGISFNRKTDLLDASSGPRLRMIAERSNAAIAGYLVEAVHEALTEIDVEESLNNWDIVTVKAWAFNLQGMQERLAEASCLMKYERRYTAQIAAIEARQSEAEDRISLRKEWFDEWNCSDVLEEFGVS